MQSFEGVYNYPLSVSWWLVLEATTLPTEPQPLHCQLVAQWLKSLKFWTWSEANVSSNERHNVPTYVSSMTTLAMKHGRPNWILSPPSHWQKSFATFANWKKYPCQYHWQRGFLALAMAARLG